MTAGRKALKPSMAHPKHPERICWGCDRLCAAEALGCANGSTRTQHPSELFGDDWEEWFARDALALESALDRDRRTRHTGGGG